MWIREEIQTVPRHFDLTRLKVVAGILRDEQGRVLITERVDDGPFHGLWEFPGGKIAEGESLEAALARELDEEIGVQPIVSAQFMSLEHEYPDRYVCIDFFLVTEWLDEPAGLEGQQLRWVEIGMLSAEQLLPADGPVVDALQQMFS
jgi:8-oxo-dGTP diphosphatase